MKKSACFNYILLFIILPFVSCSDESDDDIFQGPNKSFYQGSGVNNSNNNANNDSDENPVYEESSIAVSFLSSNLSRLPNGFEINTKAFPAVRRSQSSDFDVFIIQTTPGQLSLQLAAPKGLFGPGQALDLSSVEYFSYVIWGEDNDGNPIQVYSNNDDPRLEYITLEFYEYGPEKISGNFFIKTWFDTGNGVYEQHHMIDFNLYPDETHNLFD